MNLDTQVVKLSFFGFGFRVDILYQDKLLQEQQQQQQLEQPQQQHEVQEQKRN